MHRMFELAKALAHVSGWILLILLVLNLILIVILVRNTMVLHATRKRFSDLLNSDSSQNVEEMLIEHTKSRRELQAELDAVSERTLALERKLQRSKRHAGLIRYDAFSDIGGSQSFSMAVYDDNGDGVVVSSIVGRADCKVYGKSLKSGKSDHSLTKEEEEAILQAVASVQKSV